MNIPSTARSAAPTIDLKIYLAERQAQVNDCLDRFLPPAKSSRVADAMRYSVMVGGKRVRPILCLAAAEAVGGFSDDVLTAACAIELIHTYSLIHDDLPAMDDDILRRGKPTCHVAFDEATAILAGDGLLTMAFELLASLTGTREEDAADDCRIKVIYNVAAAAGHNGMIQGQMMDMTHEGKPVSPAELERLHRLKTGSLIKAAVNTGAVLGHAPFAQIRQLDEYAENIGIAFQIADDILNVEGDPARLGKATGTDSDRKKSTYPALFGLAESKELARKKVAAALKALVIFDNKADPLRTIACYVIERQR
jgi:geranylgeranyl diphosphate synthase type II